MRRLVLVLGVVLSALVLAQALAPVAPVVIYSWARVLGPGWKWDFDTAWKVVSGYLGLQLGEWLRREVSERAVSPQWASSGVEEMKVAVEPAWVGVSGVIPEVSFQAPQVIETSVRVAAVTAATPEEALARVVDRYRSWWYGEPDSPTTTAQPWYDSWAAYSAGLFYGLWYCEPVASSDYYAECPVRAVPNGLAITAAESRFSGLWTWESDWYNAGWVATRVGEVPEVRTSVGYDLVARGYTAWAWPAVVELPIITTHYVSEWIGTDWCGGSATVWVQGVWTARYRYRERGLGNLQIFDLEGVYPRGGTVYLSGSLPGFDGRVRSFEIGRIASSWMDAMQQMSTLLMHWRVAWASGCGLAVSVPSGVLPWDVEGAPGSGVGVRQRDGAEVWWVARPRELLKELFQPSVSLVVRLERLEGVLAERFPFSVAIALRSHVPSVVDQSVEVPCFSVGHGRELCPNPEVLGTVAAASRWGSVFVLGLGVMLWLQRRSVPWLRL